MIELYLVNNKNFELTSLDSFVRTQPVTEVYRKMDGRYCLVNQPFVDDWTAARKREKAEIILSGKYATYGAFIGDKIVGFVMLEKKLRGGCLVVDSFHVDKRYRNLGIGKQLFHQAISEGQSLGAERLYISACSSKETIGFYTALGCKLAENVIEEFALDEPYDLQLTYSLR